MHAPHFRTAPVENRIFLSLPEDPAKYFAYYQKAIFSWKQMQNAESETFPAYESN